MAADLDDATRSAVLEYVLSDVYPDRLTAEIVGAEPGEREMQVGVKVHPRGFRSTAKYALVTVEDGEVVGAEECTGRDLHRVLGPQ